MSQSPGQFDASSLNGAQQCDCWRHHSSSLVCVRSVACLGFCRFPQCKKPGSRSILSAGVMPSTYHQLTWYNSLWLWRWLPHRLSKRQSLSTTTVLFRTTFTRTIKLNLLLKWLLGSNLSQLINLLGLQHHSNFRKSCCDFLKRLASCVDSMLFHYFYDS